MRTHAVYSHACKKVQLVCNLVENFIHNLITAKIIQNRRRKRKQHEKSLVPLVFQKEQDALQHWKVLWKKRQKTQKKQLNDLGQVQGKGRL